MDNLENSLVNAVCAHGCNCHCCHHKECACFKCKDRQTCHDCAPKGKTASQKNRVFGQHASTVRCNRSFSVTSCSSLCMNAFTASSLQDFFIEAVTIFNAEFFFSWLLALFPTTTISVFALFVSVLSCRCRPFFPQSTLSLRRRQTRHRRACLVTVNRGWITAACSPANGLHEISFCFSHIPVRL
jgi:hypothetical protein